MAIDDVTAGSPGWWLIRLGKKLEASQHRFELLDRYYTGRHPLPSGDPNCREAFRRFQRKARSNFTGLVVDSVRERLKVVGFRAGGKGTDETDDQAWQVWQANNLDATSNQVHTAVLKFSSAYVIIGAPGDANAPVITGEDPRQVVHEPDPCQWRTPVAALKTYKDEIRKLRLAVVYLPDAIYYFSAGLATTSWMASTWSVDNDAGDDGTVGEAENTIGVVPVVPFVNRPDLFGVGLGEFEDVVDIQDRINNTILDRMVISKMQAYRQRWGTGMDLTDEDGVADVPFIPGVDKLWAVEDKDAKFGDFQESNLQGVLASISDDVQHLAAISRTPPHYLLGQIVNASGDALKAAETGLVAKANDRMVELGESWEQVNRIAGLYTDRQVPVDAEVIWADPESRSMAELADAAVKKQAAGVPWRQRMVDLGYSPPEINRMDSQRSADAILGSFAAPKPAAPSGNGAALPVAAR